MKFTNKGNTININIKKENIHGMDEVIVNIIDTGIGIDSEIFPRLFTKFAYKFKWRWNWLGFVLIQMYYRGP